MLFLDSRSTGKKNSHSLFDLSIIAKEGKPLPEWDVHIVCSFGERAQSNAAVDRIIADAKRDITKRLTALSICDFEVEV